MQRIMMMTVLMTGLFFFGASQVKAQDCKSLKTLELQKDCWVKKANSGEENLQGAYLVGANFDKVELRFRNLSGAKLNKAILTGTDLAGTDLTGADLSGADLSGSVMTEKEIAEQGYKSVEDWIKDADMRYDGVVMPTIVDGTKLVGAILTGAIVSRRRTYGINFDDWKKRGGIVVD